MKTGHEENEGGGDDGKVYLSGEELAAAMASEPKPTGLFALIEEGDDAEIIKAALSAGEQLETRDGRGLTPLLWAAVNGRSETLIFLLHAGADISARENTEGSDGRGALMLASAVGDEDSVRALLEAGEPVNARALLSDATALYFASSSGRANVVRVLLEYGAAVDAAPKTSGTTPLCAAAEMGNADVMRELLDAGANADKANKVGQTARLAAQPSLQWLFRDGSKVGDGMFKDL